MKILIVSTHDIQGGAAKASYRLHKALLNTGIDSQMLVQSKKTDELTIIGPKNKYEKGMEIIRPELDKLPLLFYKNEPKEFFSISWFSSKGIIDKINEINPDIVHLHWVNDGMIKIEDLLKIKQPIVWSLHDMWLFTGGCHYDRNCGKYESQCRECNILTSRKKNDLSYKIFNRKKKIFNKIKNMTIIGLSEWLTNCAKSSSLLINKNVINLPNIIDTEKYSPIAKKVAKKLLNLKENKKYILFGAMNSTLDLRKGYKELKEAINHSNLENTEILVFGSSKPANDLIFKYKTHYLGYFNDELSMKILYNAADVMIVPSLQENLSNIIMESLSCGTPVVAFNIGGNKDMIEHKKNGYLSEPLNSNDLANGIEWVLNSSSYDDLVYKARKKILNNFDSKTVIKKYIKLYNNILKSKI